MSFITVAVPSQSSVLHAYLTSVGSAARALIAALLAVKPQQESVTVTPHRQKLLERERVQKAKYLNGLAQQYDASMPNFSAELRYFASRG